MARWLILYPSDRGEKAAKIVNDPSNAVLPFNVSSETVGITDLGADNLDYIVELPDTDVPLIVDHETDQEVMTTFYDIEG